MNWWLWWPILAAALISGASCAGAGFILSHLRLSFLGVTMSHAAMAGAVGAKLLGLPVFGPALAAALLAALAIGLLSDRAGLDINLAMGMVFSLSMGLAFLGIGLATDLQSDLLGLIWGSILLASRLDLVLISFMGAGLALLLFIFEKEIKAVLFSRAVAAASGVRERVVTYALLAAAGAVITASLEAVGGMMLFALLVNPVAAASRWWKSFRGALGGAAFLGAVSAAGGLGLSLVAGWPAGASIVLISGAVFAVSILTTREK